MPELPKISDINLTKLSDLINLVNKIRELIIQIEKYKFKLNDQIIEDFQEATFNFTRIIQTMYGININSKKLTFSNYEKDFNQFDIKIEQLNETYSYSKFNENKEFNDNLEKSFDLFLNTGFRACEFLNMSYYHEIKLISRKYSLVIEKICPQYYENIDFPLERIKTRISEIEANINSDQNGKLIKFKELFKEILKLQIRYQKTLEFKPALEDNLKSRKKNKIGWTITGAVITFFFTWLMFLIGQQQTNMG